MQVGWQLIDQYATCMNLPLYRKYIHGSSAKQVGAHTASFEPQYCPPSVAATQTRQQYLRLHTALLTIGRPVKSTITGPVNTAAEHLAPWSRRCALQDLSYSHTEGDEVEDLYILLSYVKDSIPGLGAVTSGAIASDYQRLRVEHVCSRLNLVSLAYLWHQPQRQLLRCVPCVSVVHRRPV